MLFTSIDKIHTIELIIFGDIAELKIITFHYESYKTFLLLLKTVIEYMTSKNIIYVKQRILETDISLFNYSTYVYTNDHTNYHTNDHTNDHNDTNYHNDTNDHTNDHTNDTNDHTNDHDHNNDHRQGHIKTVLITTPIVHIVEEIYNALGLKRL